MQKDLLAELHLPELDIKSVQNIVTQNSARLAFLIKESNECLNKSKAVPLHFKEVKESMVSDVDGHTESTPNESVKPLKQKFIVKNSLISSDDAFKNKTDAGNSVVTQDCTVEDKNKSVESVQASQNFLPNFETPAKVFPVTESEPLNIGSSLPKEKTSVSLICRKPSVSSGVSLLKINNNISSHPESVSQSAPVKNVAQPEPASNKDKESEPSFCVISEVVGNATAAFSQAEDTEKNAREKPEVQLITPKKTNDITKIKGWRRKQFFVEKPTTIEFYSIGKGSLSLKNKINLKNNENNEIKSEEPENVENAFVCDSLDDFLDREAELKIGYEIPHLYAEFGIKLTRNEIVSKPNLSETDIKEVETRYCVPVSVPCETIDLDEVKEENIKGIKRQNSDETKHCKVLKLEENKRQPVQCAETPEDESKIEESVSESKNSSEESESNARVEQSNIDLSKIKLVSKLIALVVYPGPYVPLHPIVRYHLDKIRCYRTKVDKNWANFAASAILDKEKPYKRKILPAYCCAKTEMDPTVINEMEVEKEVDCISVVSEPEDHEDTENETENEKMEPIKLKKCSVVLEKLDSVGTRAPWCMEHNCYNCENCGLDRSKDKRIYKPSKTKKRTRNEDLVETVIVSPQASFDKKIADLLAKKVRLLKANGDTLKSIDCLKTLTVNTVEFIKLKFVKESFLSGYLNIWYLKPEVSGVRFRAFLTFSHTPPLPNAINLKSSVFSLQHLPKVITEIISAENTFDSNEYAILHCDGKIWEIHGSLNIAFGKCDKNVEQIFTSAELPELKTLQEIAHDILRVKAVKWWVLDLSQTFTHMELKYGHLSVIVTRKMFIETLRMNLFGYLPLRRTPDGRVLGAFLMQRLLPFVLIGPYYLLESNDMTLKDESLPVPFMYYGEENVTMDYPLKFFINSVIKNIANYEKKLEGLWLYDKMCLDSTSYLEVVTTNVCFPTSNKYSSIDIEHGYSLNSLTNSSPPGVSSGIVKRKDGKEEFKKITVYLYFDIFELGYVEGELQFDNSVIISHPLDKRTKMKSHKIGDWFIGIIKRRIEFIPKDLVVRWFITKHKDDLRERRPFNKFFLGGAHILTKNGVFYLLEMSDTKMDKLGIDRKEIVKAIAQSEVIKEVKELKRLSNLLVNDPDKSLSMFEVLTKAVDEIKKLREEHQNLKNEKAAAEKEKLKLCSELIKKLNQCRIPFHLKIKIIERLEPMFTNDKGNLKESFAKTLRYFKIGRKYLNRVEKSAARAKALEERIKYLQSVTKKTSKPKVIYGQVNTGTQEKAPSSKKSKPAILNVSRSTTVTKDPPKYSIPLVKTENPGSVSSASIPVTSVYPNVVENSTSIPVRETLVEHTIKKEIKTEIDETPPSDFGPKNDKFLKLTSPELPDNIKLCWKNWSVNKFEVV